MLPYVRETTSARSCTRRWARAAGRDDGRATTFEDSDWRAQASAFTGEKFRQNLDVVERLRSFAADKGVEVCSWRSPGCWPRTDRRRDRRRPVGQDIERSLAAVDVTLSAEDLAEIEKITADGVQVSGAAPEGVS